MKRLAPLAVLFLLLAAAGVFYLSYSFNRPGPLSEAKTIMLARGEGFNAISRHLALEGVIASETVFKAGVVAHRQYARFKAGEYAFPAGISASEVMQMLAEGKTVIRKFTAPEGWRASEILKALSEESSLSGQIEIKISEGSLLPETYHYHFGDSREALVARMQEGMRETLDALWAKRAANLPLATKEEALTLASIVEKETGIADERPRVAAVFINRLRRGMKLQSDPTTIYAIEMTDGALNRPLTTADLQRELPYNTYTIPALPPGPIACPGVAALEAVLNPPPTEELYFVATGAGDGRHYFARTLTEHNANVARYRARVKAAP